MLPKHYKPTAWVFGPLQFRQVPFEFSILRSLLGRGKSKALNLKDGNARLLHSTFRACCCAFTMCRGSLDTDFKPRFSGL